VKILEKIERKEHNYSTDYSVDDYIARIVRSLVQTLLNAR